MTKLFHINVPKQISELYKELLQTNIQENLEYSAKLIPGNDNLSEQHITIITGDEKNIKYLINDAKNKVKQKNALPFDQYLAKFDLHEKGDKTFAILCDNYNTFKMNNKKK